MRKKRSGVRQTRKGKKQSTISNITRRGSRSGGAQPRPPPQIRAQPQIWAQRAHLLAAGGGNRRRGFSGGGRGRVELHGLRSRRRLHGGLDGTVGQPVTRHREGRGVGGSCLLACGCGRGGSLARSALGVGEWDGGVVWSSSAFDRSAPACEDCRRASLSTAWDSRCLAWR